VNHYDQQSFARLSERRGLLSQFGDLVRQAHEGTASNTELDCYESRGARDELRGVQLSGHIGLGLDAKPGKKNLLELEPAGFAASARKKQNLPCAELKVG